MEFNVPAATGASETPATGGAAASSGGAGATPAASAPSGAEMLGADADSVLSAASYLLRATPPTLKDFVVDVANSRTNAKLLVEMLPRVLDVTAEVALARVVAASAGLVQPGATPAEEALGKVHERLCATRKKLRHNMAVGALAFTFEHPRVDMAVDLSVDDVMGALAALTCLPVESLAVHLSTADAARATTCELRSQLEAAYRVVWHLPARQRLLELEALETAALSKPPQALEVRYHELHAPLREARRAVYDGMEDAVAAQDVLMRYPGARGFMAAFASRAPTVVGARKLQQLVESGGLSTKQLVLYNPAVDGRRSLAVNGGRIVAWPLIKESEHVWRVEPTEELGIYRLALPGTQSAVNPRTPVLEAPAAVPGRYRCCSRDEAKHDKFNVVATDDGTIRLCSVTQGDGMVLDGTFVSHRSGVSSVTWLPIQLLAVPTAAAAGADAASAAAGAAAAAAGRSGTA